MYFISSIEQELYKRIKETNQIVCIQVFEGLINLLASDEMITIQNPDIEATATSFILSEKINFKKIAIDIGDYFEKKNNIFFNEKLSFDFSKASRYDATLEPSKELVWDKNHLEIIRRQIERQILSIDHAGGIANSLIYKSSKPLDFFQMRFVQLLSPFEENDNWNLDDFLIVIGKIIGLGAGLTPSGDDFLIGFMSVLRYFSKTKSIDNHLSYVSKVTNEVLNKTTTVSRAFLKCALSGQFAQSIVSFYEGQTKGDTNQKLNSLKRISEHGSSSGVDTLNGILFGIKWISGSNQVEFNN